MVYRRKFRSSNFRQYGQIGKAQPGRSSDIQKARREWLRSAIHPSQNQPLLVSYLGNFRHRLVRYYWYQLSMVIWWMVYYCYTHITFVIAMSVEVIIISNTINYYKSIYSLISWVKDG